MRPINAPLKLGDRGPEVSNLQDALQFLIERRAIQMPESDGTSLLERLRRDREQEFYSDAGTYPIIQLFQRQLGLTETGVVDAATAAKLTELLRELSAFSDLDIWTVQGYVTQAGKPKSGIKVEAYDRDLRKRQLLGRALTGSDGRYHIEYRLADFAEGDRKDRPAPWLVVEATPAEDDRKVVVQKGRDVQREETVNLAFEATPLSEFERIADAILPLLDGQGDDGGSLNAWQLGEDDMLFLLPKLVSIETNYSFGNWRHRRSETSGYLDLARRRHRGCPPEVLQPPVQTAQATDLNGLSSTAGSATARLTSSAI